MLEELNEVNKYIHNKIKKYRTHKVNILDEIEEDAERNNVPIISKDVAEYLKYLIRKNENIKNILEIGTATAYSGITMLAEIKERNGNLTTIEIDENRFNIAKSNFKKANLNNITQILGDATEEIKKLNTKFDFIFIDAAKGQYKTFFEDSYKLLEDNGIIFIDNILFRGYLYKECPKRFKTIARKLDEFIEYLYENYNFILLPISDGVGIVWR